MYSILVITAIFVPSYAPQKVHCECITIGIIKINLYKTFLMIPGEKNNIVVLLFQWAVFYINYLKISIFLNIDTQWILFLVCLDLDTVINDKMYRDGQIWFCTDCNFQSPKKSNVHEHIESKHVTHSGYYCDICSKLCPTKSSLRMHYNRNHKVSTWLNKELYPFDWFSSMSLSFL